MVLSLFSAVKTITIFNGPVFSLRCEDHPDVKMMTRMITATTKNYVAVTFTALRFPNGPMILYFLSLVTMTMTVDQMMMMTVQQKQPLFPVSLL